MCKNNSNSKSYPMVFFVSAGGGHAGARTESCDPLQPGLAVSDPANPREVLTLMGLTALQEVTSARDAALAAVRNMLAVISKHEEAFALYSKGRSPEMPDMDDIVSHVATYGDFFAPFVNGEGPFAPPVDAEAPAAPKKKPSKAAAAAAAAVKAPSPKRKK